MTVGTTISLSATELHLRDKLLDVALTLLRARPSTVVWADALVYAKAQLDDTRQFEHLVSRPLWAKRNALRHIQRMYSREARPAAPAELDLDESYLEGLCE